ncbi:hypothetical protein PR002_g8183 [Phytophthora rubi]|uniref:RxLR effector protein n=1 Tax=Phytophthora rubi TaxID=129364 RepID=A0A6A3MSJ2_9STRA|nr:hypothetical protein PR002_g8183 [Phytophthora rubi]
MPLPRGWRLCVVLGGCCSVTAAAAAQPVELPATLIQLQLQRAEQLAARLHRNGGGLSPCI